MERTKNLKLIKPAVSEYYDVEQFNQNSDIIDEAIQKANEDIEDVNKRLTTADGLKFQFAKNEDGKYGYVNENGEFEAFKQGGSNSVVLPPVPSVSIRCEDAMLLLSWEQPKATETEVDIASYNIYMSDTVPFSLADMQLIATQEAGYKKMDYEYNLDVEESDFTFKVRNNQLYIDGENYAEYYISPALQFEAGKSYRLSGADGTKCRMFVYGSDAINGGTIATDAGDGCEFTATASAALPLAFSVEPDRNYDSRFHIGIEEKVRENSYVIEGLENDKVYFIAVQAVTADGIENASIYVINRGVPTPTIFLCSMAGTGVYTSRDGINWTLGEGATVGLKAVAFGNGRFVGLDNSSSSTNAYYSDDYGATWVSAGVINSSSSSALTDITYGNGKFVAVGRNGYAFYSSDGVTWTAITQFGTVNINAVTYANNMFVAVCDSATICYSTDGQTWKNRFSLSSGGNFYDIVFGNGRFVVVGVNGTTYQATDPTTSANWTLLGGMSNINMNAVAYGNGKFVAVGVQGYMYYLNDDATKWIQVSKKTSENLDVITFASDRFVVDYATGKTTYSKDAINWTVESTGLASKSIIMLSSNK